MSGYAKISIHALLAESDCNLTQKKHPLTISIHALLAESDPGARHTGQQNAVYFYPRSPCGERPRIHSTSGGHPGISIHALLAESDSMGLDGRFKL